MKKIRFLRSKRQSADVTFHGEDTNTSVEGRLHDTLKRYYPEPEKHRVRLHPENDNMKDFFVRECIVQGVAKKVFKMRNIE